MPMFAYVRSFEWLGTLSDIRAGVPIIQRSGANPSFDSLSVGHMGRTSLFCPFPVQMRGQNNLSATCPKTCRIRAFGGIK